MSFFYLFVPTWIFTIIIYTLLAARYGAKESYPEEEQKEQEYQESISKFQDDKAELEPDPIIDRSIFTKILKVVSVVALIITLVLAGLVLFGSANENNYITNRALFYKYAFICTLLYFITAYWATRRGKIKKEKH